MTGLKRRARVLGLIFSLCVLTPGCGGDNGSTSTPQSLEDFKALPASERAKLTKRWKLREERCLKCGEITFAQISRPQGAAGIECQKCMPKYMTVCLACGSGVFAASAPTEEAVPICPKCRDAGKRPEPNSKITWRVQAVWAEVSMEGKHYHSREDCPAIKGTMTAIKMKMVLPLTGVSFPSPYQRHECPQCWK